MSNRRKSRQARQSRRASHTVYFDPGSDERQFIGPYEVIKIDDESHFDFGCPECGSKYCQPFAGLRAPKGVGPPDQMEIGCEHCDFKTELTLSPEHHNDGTTTYWFDERALRSSSGTTEHLALELELEDGRRVIHMLGQKEDGTLATCDDCGLPWTQKGEMSLTSLSDDPVSLNLIAGPCPHCGGMGKAAQRRRERGGLVTFATSQAYADSALQALIEGMASGEIDRLEAASILRGRGDRPSVRIAEWLETHAVAINTASAILTALAAVGALTVSVSQDHQPPTNGYTEDEVIEIIDTVLDHYDRVHDQEQMPDSRRGKRTR